MTVDASDTTQEKSLRTQIGKVQTKIENLLDVAEAGTVAGPSIHERLTQLEREKRELETRVERLVNVGRRSSATIDEVVARVKKFIADFEVKITQAPIEQQKLLMQKCIERIVIDRPANVARFYVRPIPAVDPLINELLGRADQAVVMSAEGARNRT
jgi:hypothetical protein